MSAEPREADGPDLRGCELCGHARPEALFAAGGFHIVRCPSCGLQYVGDAPPETELASYYDAAYWEEPDRPGYSGYVEDAGRKRHHFRALLSRMESFHSPGDLLEIGCAYGFFLDEARKRGWAVRGVEPSADAASYASRELGLDVYSGPLEGADLPESSCDAVVLWDVVEHLPQPLRTLRLASSLLRPGGLLALSTGDVDSLAARVQGADWSLYTPPWHLFFFSKRTVRRLLTQAGLEVEAIDGDGVVVDPLASRSRVPRPIVRLLAGRWPATVGRALGVGMIKVVYARRSDST